MVEARIFTIFTDHKPLIFAFSKSKDIAQFTTDLKYLPGKENLVADALSRVEEITAAVNYDDLARAQDKNPKLQNLLLHGSTLQLKRINTMNGNLPVYCDTSVQPPRHYVTHQFRKQVFDTVHSLHHPESSATVRLVLQRYVWPGIRKDCCKITRHTISPLSFFLTPSSRFSHIHLDIVGPLILSSGYRYCLTVINRFTRWPEAYPMVDVTATCAATLVSGWIARFGYAALVITDRGRQFGSHLFKALTKLVDVRHLRTTPYHPAANGIIERLHRQLKAAILCHTSSQWTEALPLVLLDMRNSWKEDLQPTPAELVYGQTLSLPGQYLSALDDYTTADFTEYVTRLQSCMAKITPKQISWHTSTTTPFYIPWDLHTSSHVFLQSTRQTSQVLHYRHKGKGK
ncbi:unnamed protein product [Parnassius mnemosyne]|uniref:RNA-directed DNA polymerase n=1 Tax=Parnassius mnemosyne TaxID=213953 RepID=A0AAV1L1G7_9NEOP